MKNIINYGNSLKSNVNLYKVKNYIKNNKKDNNNPNFYEIKLITKMRKN